MQNIGRPKRIGKFVLKVQDICFHFDAGSYNGKKANVLGLGKVQLLQHKMIQMKLFEIMVGHYKNQAVFSE